MEESNVQSATEHIRTVWSTSNCLGIRSLPDALSPDFRTRLYEEIVSATKRERAGTARRKPDLSYGLEGGPLSMPLSVGQKQVARIHPLAGTFTQFEYIPSEYDRVKLMGKFDRLRHKLQQVAPSEFVVKAPPQAPKGAPAFSEFNYANDPYNAAEATRRADEDVNRSRIVMGPFYPPGRVDRGALLKGRVDECLMGLCKLLSADWPTGFLQVFEDRNGSIVMSFERGRAITEGDLSSYMNTLSKTSPMVAAYRLLKDASQWGLVDEETQAVFYVMWPPWVRHRYVGQRDIAAGVAASLQRPGSSGSSDGQQEDDLHADGAERARSSGAVLGSGVYARAPGAGSMLRAGGVY